MMKRLKLTILLTMLLSMVGVNALAHDFEVANDDGVTIYYKKTSDTEVAVSYRGWAYYNCSNEYTGNVVIPELVTHDGTTYLVTSIDENAFYGCYGLTSVIIPNSVTVIGNDAFGGCWPLTSITIPNSVTSIGRGVFQECFNLTSITVESGNKVYDSRDDCNAIIKTETNELIASCLNTIIPNSVTGIGDYAFYCRTDLTSFTISNNVISIGDYAFCGCSGLTSLPIGNSVTSIGKNAFSGCSGLTSVTIPNSVTSIGVNAFLSCSGLTSVTIGNGVTSIGNYAFEKCRSLTSVTLGNSVTSIGMGAFYDCSSLALVTLHCKEIGSWFRGLTSIKKVIIGDEVTSIGWYSFYGCQSLTDVYCLPTNVPTTGSPAFEGANITENGAVLHVPIGCAEKYAAVAPWSDFVNIVEIGGDIVESVELVMTAQEDNGLVRLRFNSVPGDISYRVNRTDDNGANASFDEKGSHYPDKMEFVDNPPATGTYTYYVKMAYLDSEGEQHVAKSNKETVSVTIPEPQQQEEQEEGQQEEPAIEYGFITGRIVCDKNPPVSGLKVRFSDDVTVNARGTIFSRYRIPVGTELTMTVLGDPSHDYVLATFPVKPGPNTVVIFGMLKDDYEPNENAHDLQIAPDFSVYSRDGKHYVKCTLINPHASFSWGGTVSAEVIPYYESFKSWWTGEKPVYRGEVTVPSLRSENTQVVDIALNGLEVDKDTKFKLYLKSNGKWLRDGFYDETAEKSLITTTGWDITDYEVVIEKTESSDGTYKKWNKVAREDFSYLMLGLSSITPGMEGIVGDFSNYQYRNKMVTFAKEFTGEVSETQAIMALFDRLYTDWLAGKTALEMINEFSLFNVSSFSYDLIQELKNIVLPQQSIFQKLRKDYIITASDIQDASGMIGSISSVASAITSHDPFECIMNCASAFYGLASEGTVPLRSMIKTYMVVGESLINAAKALQVIVHDNELPDRMLANKARRSVKEGVHADGVKSYNTTCDFKLVVQTDGLFGGPIDFTLSKYRRQVTDIVVKASNTNVTSTFLFDLEYQKDGIMLKLKSNNNVIFANGIKSVINEESGGGNYGLTKFYMEIHWSNEHVTIIPLNQSANGLDIKCGDRGPRFDGENLKPSLYTVTLTTTTGKDNMADELYLGTNKARQ